MNTNSNGLDTYSEESRRGRLARVGYKIYGSARAIAEESHDKPLLIQAGAGVLLLGAGFLSSMLVMPGAVKELFRGPT